MYAECPNCGNILYPQWKDVTGNAAVTTPRSLQCYCYSCGKLLVTVDGYMYDAHDRISDKESKGVK